MYVVIRNLHYCLLTNSYFFENIFRTFKLGKFEKKKTFFVLIPVSWKTLQRSVLLVCFSMSVSSLLRSCSSLIISRNCFTLASLLRQSWSSSIISSKYSPIIFTARLLGEGERNVKTNYTKRKNLINLICQLEKLANSRVVCRGS